MSTLIASAATPPAQRAALPASTDALAPSTRRGATAAGFSLAGAVDVTPMASIGEAGRSTPAATTNALRVADERSVARDPGAQRQVGRLQQGLDYLDRLADSMQRLKGELSGTLARQAAPSATLTAEVDRLRQLWANREQEAGGRVDGQLQPAASPDSEVRQRFRLRGLDLAVLTQGGRETLRLQLPGQPADEAAGTTASKPVTVAVTLDGEGTQAQLRALTQALAPAGLNVQTQGGEIVLSVAESKWPALRDGLTMRGEGRRFPSGQPVRALLEPEPEAMAPQRWNVQDSAGQRQALGVLLQAQPRVAQARQALGEQLRAAASPSEPHVDGVTPTRTTTTQTMTPSAQQAEALAGALTERMAAAGFAEVGALLPALRGLDRQRVRQLLMPR